MMDGDPPSISLVFRRPVTHPTHPGLRWDLVSCWLSFHFVPRVRFRCRRTVSRATAPCVAYTPARSLRQHLKSSAFAFIGVFHPVSAWLSTKLISGSLSPTIIAQILEHEEDCLDLGLAGWSLQGRRLRQRIPGYGTPSKLSPLLKI